jgi:1-acyl-sn-glycerol-3-phosphate acyltransferase
MPTRKPSRKSSERKRDPRSVVPPSDASPPSAPPPSEPSPSSETYATFDAPRTPVPTEPPEEEAGESVGQNGARSPGAEAATVDEVEEQIRKLELQLDRMIQKSKKKAVSPEGHAGRAARAIAERLNVPPELERPGGDDGGVMDAARDLLSSDYYLRQWGRIAMRNRSEEVDEFGYDPKYAARWQPLFDFLYKRYFRVDAIGTTNIPSEGRCLVVANHSGALPFDGAMLKTAMLHAHPAKRDFRWLAEDFIFYLPFLGAFMNRIGAVRACQENAERLLKLERLVGVFPEGVKGIGKLYRDRYKVQRFGRGGIIRLCLRTATPIVPCAVIGAEESMPMLYRLEYFANVFGVPYLPVTPTFPALGPLGLVPAPTKWRISFGEPIRFDGYGPEAADDSLLVGRLTEKVRSTIQGMLDRGISERQSVWFG